jgi:hypothetical protein
VVGLRFGLTTNEATIMKNDKTNEKTDALDLNKAPAKIKLRPIRTGLKAGPSDKCSIPQAK